MENEIFVFLVVVYIIGHPAATEENFFVLFHVDESFHRAGIVVILRRPDVSFSLGAVFGAIL